MPTTSSPPSAQCLLEALASVPDPRGFKGRRHSIQALLGGLFTGFACGCNTMRSVIIFLRERRSLRKQLGFTHPKSPSQSTYSRLFEELSVGDLRRALGGWLAAAGARRSDTAVAIDGKAQFKAGLHVLHAFSHDWKRLVDLFEVDAKKNELSAFRDALDEMLERYPFLAIFTFDAAYCDRTLAKKLTGQGKRALFQVKGNQPETLRRLERWFASLPKEKPDFESVEKKEPMDGAPQLVGKGRAR